jgi:hypothetical protein
MKRFQAFCDSRKRQLTIERRISRRWLVIVTPLQIAVTIVPFPAFMMELFSFCRLLQPLPSNTRRTSSKVMIIRFALSILFTLNWSTRAMSDNFLNCLGPRKYPNNSDFRYESLIDYTSDMCSLCYNFINTGALKLVEIKDPQTGKTIIDRPYVYYTNYKTGYLRNRINGTFRVVDPAKFNRENPNEDIFLDSIAIDFHRVSYHFSLGIVT